LSAKINLEILSVELQRKKVASLAASTSFKSSESSSSAFSYSVYENDIFFVLIITLFSGMDYNGSRKKFGVNQRLEYLKFNNSRYSVHFNTLVTPLSVFFLFLS
jgi:predicted small integral membrane protein